MFCFSLTLHYLCIMRILYPIVYAFFYVVSLLLAAGTMIEDIIWCYQVTVQAVWYIPYAILLFSMLALAPALERGTKKWGT